VCFAGKYPFVLLWLGLILGNFIRAPTLNKRYALPNRERDRSKQATTADGNFEFYGPVGGARVGRALIFQRVSGAEQHF
jgi:hypothetical protein